MKIFSKYKNFMSDMILNMIGFGIYIFSQQILLLPLLAKMVDDNLYASFVLYVSVLNVVCNVTGGEVGNSRMILNMKYHKQQIIGDFTRILFLISLAIVVILFPIFTLVFKYSVFGTIILILTILMANIRLYSTCYYRLNEQYIKVIYQNILYLIRNYCISWCFLFCKKYIYIVVYS